MSNLKLQGAFKTPITERIPWAPSKDPEVPLHLEYSQLTMSGRVKEIVDATEKVIGKKLNYDYAPRRAGDPAKLTADAALAQKILEWKPRYTDMEEIIRTVWNLEI